MEYELIVDAAEESNRINAQHLSDFLKTFRSAYVVALAFLEYENVHEYRSYVFPENSMRDLDASFQRFILASGMLGSTASLAKRPLDGNLELEFLHISTNSPLRFIGYCTGTSLLALALAVSLAGGEADLKNMKFKVNPLLESTAKIARQLRR